MCSAAPSSSDEARPARRLLALPPCRSLALWPCGARYFVAPFPKGAPVGAPAAPGWDGVRCRATAAMELDGDVQQHVGGTEGQGETRALEMCLPRNAAFLFGRRTWVHPTAPVQSLSDFASRGALTGSLKDEQSDIQGCP
jgi:hypothetical protein